MNPSGRQNFLKMASVLWGNNTTVFRFRLHINSMLLLSTFSYLLVLYHGVFQYCMYGLYFSFIILVGTATCSHYHDHQLSSQLVSVIFVRGHFRCILTLPSCWPLVTESLEIRIEARWNQPLRESFTSRWCSSQDSLSFWTLQEGRRLIVWRAETIITISLFHRVAVVTSRGVLSSASGTDSRPPENIKAELCLFCNQ